MCVCSRGASEMRYERGREEVRADRDRLGLHHIGMMCSVVFVLSTAGITCHVILYHVISYHVIPCHVLSCHASHAV